MRIVAAVMLLTALWLVLGAVLHGGHARTRDVAGEAWWWESFQRSGDVTRHPLPSSHPLARLGRAPSRSTT